MNMEILGIGSRVIHPGYGPGVIIKLHEVAYDVVFTQYGLKQVGKKYSEWEIVEAVPHTEEVSFTAAEQSLIRILSAYQGIDEKVELGDRWTDGTLILQPGDTSLKTKEMPIDTFFHKIVMVRDRLRVMEQRINSSSMTDEEKINLQQYITRIYGSLTSFNVLFRHRDESFKGEGKS